MNTTTNREVTPQWGAGISDSDKGNLGTYTLPSKEFDEVSIATYCSKYPGALACIANNQVHIMRSGAAFGDAVKAKLPAPDGEEKLADWLVKTRKSAREVGAEVAKTFVLDFPAFAEHFATEVFPKRGLSKDKRVTLENYEAVESALSAKWSVWTAEERAKACGKLKLDGELNTLDEALKALAVKYRKPTAVNVDVDALAS